jgi:hypothetical protein
LAGSWIIQVTGIHTLPGDQGPSAAVEGQDLVEGPINIGSQGLSTQQLANRSELLIVDLDAAATRAASISAVISPPSSSSAQRAAALAKNSLRERPRRGRVGNSARPLEMRRPGRQ